MESGNVPLGSRSCCRIRWSHMLVSFLYGIAVINVMFSKRTLKDRKMTFEMDDTLFTAFPFLHSRSINSSTSRPPDYIHQRAVNEINSHFNNASTLLGKGSIAEGGSDDIVENYASAGEEEESTFIEVEDVAAASRRLPLAGKLHHIRPKKKKKKRKKSWKAILFSSFGTTKVSWTQPLTSNKSWESPYVSHQKASLPNISSCRPFCRFDSPPSDKRSISTLNDLQLPQTRTLVVVPRFGLGNALRGYVSSYIYSILSSRRLVLFHGGPHFEPLDALCTAFHCDMDAIHWQRYGSPKNAYDKLQSLQPKPYFVAAEMQSSGYRKRLRYRQATMVMQSGNHFDGYWVGNKRLLRCVHAAFKCRRTRTSWCIHSRAIQALLGGGPSEILDRTIQSVLQQESSAGAALPQDDESVPGVDIWFDLALHLRTRTVKMENGKSAECTGKCEEKMDASLKSIERRYTNDHLWECIGKMVVELSKYMPASRNRSMLHGGYKIFLATDNELLRPIFVEKLKKFGTVYYSQGGVTHTSKAKNFVDRMPTMAEFYLMSRAHVLLEAEEYVSTFAKFAAMYGNITLATLIHRRAEKKCRVYLYHSTTQSGGE